MLPPKTPSDSFDPTDPLLTEWGHPNDTIRTSRETITYGYWLELERQRLFKAGKKTEICFNEDGQVALRKSP